VQISDDLFPYYNRISNRNTLLRAALAMGFPGADLQRGGGE
jgi:hypothetical protein